MWSEASDLSLQVFSLSFNFLHFPFLKCGINSSGLATASPALRCGYPQFTPTERNSVPSLVPLLVRILPGQAGQPHPLIKAQNIN